MIALLSRWLLPLIAGALFVPALAPYDLWPLAPLSAGLLYWQLLRQSPGKAFLTGWLYGAGFFGVGASWVYVSIHVYGNASPALAGLLTLIFCAGLALLFGCQTWLFRRLAGTRALAGALAFPALWVLFEWLRSWLLTGFPWLYAGYATLAMPLSGWAPLFGVWGGSLVLVAWGAVPVALARTVGLPRTAAVSAVLVVLTVTPGWWLQGVDWTRVAGKPLAVAIYQPNIPLEQKWDRRYAQAIFNQFTDATVPLFAEADLVLWPEGALPAYRHQISAYLDGMADLASAAEATLVTGIPAREGEARHNSILALGAGSGIYHKQRLVPFGEYVPLEAWLRGLIDFFDLPMSQFVPGADDQPLLEVAGRPVATLICYEVVYPDFSARQGAGADFLITVSNDSWFGASLGPLQHLQMARFRALEQQRDMLRGTNNGVSAIIGPRGELKAASDQFVETTLTGQVTPRRGTTPFVRWGSLPVLVLSGLMLAAAGFLGRRHGADS